MVTDEQVHAALWMYTGKAFPSKKKLRKMRAALEAAAQVPVRIDLCTVCGVYPSHVEHRHADPCAGHYHDAINPPGSCERKA